MVDRHKSIGIGRLGYDFHVHVSPFLLRLVLKTKRRERLYLMYEKNEEAWWRFLSTRQTNKSIANREAVKAVHEGNHRKSTARYSATEDIIPVAFSMKIPVCFLLPDHAGVDVVGIRRCNRARLLHNADAC